MNRVAITGMGGISPIGIDWESSRKTLLSQKNCVVYMKEWEKYEGLNTRLASPAADFESTLPKDKYNRKKTRSMGRISLMSVRATELALEQAGLLDDPILKSGQVGVAYGSSSGSPDAIGHFGMMRQENKVKGITATTYVKMMPHTAAVNIALFFGLKGRVIPSSSACTSGSQSIGYAFESIRYGRQKIMLAGGGEELCATQAAVFDVMYATSTKNETPHESPRPFDKNRDGLVIGEGASSLVLEDYEHALARGATIYAEILGFSTNTDGEHITQPSSDIMLHAAQEALVDAGLQAADIGYVNAHATATEIGDIAESQAIYNLFGSKVPVSSLKSYMGHTLGACGALDSFMSIMMMREGWFAPTINLENVDERCADLDYIIGKPRQLETDIVMNNNFAFGGINTSLIFKRL